MNFDILLIFNRLTFSCFCLSELILWTYLPLYLYIILYNLMNVLWRNESCFILNGLFPHYSILKAFFPFFFQVLISFFLFAPEDALYKGRNIVNKLPNYDYKVDQNEDCHYLLITSNFYHSVRHKNDIPQFYYVILLELSFLLIFNIKNYFKNNQKQWLKGVQ